MRKFLLKRLLPFLASNIRPDIDTVIKGQDIFIRIRISVFDFVVADWVIPTPFNTKDDASDKGMRQSLLDVDGVEEIRSLTGSPKILKNKSLIDFKKND